MTEEKQRDRSAKLTLGQAIDQVIAALGSLEASDQQTVLRAVYAHLNISGPGNASASGRAPEIGGRTEPVGVVPPPVTRHVHPSMDIRAFKEEKNPSSARQMACVVAYYLAEIAGDDERKSIVTTDDIEKYFKQARFVLPTKLEQLLIDCRGAGYFESTGRGEYKLTRVGHNLVAHQLPKRGKE